MKRLTAILFLAVLLVARSTRAWSGAGHQVIAAEADRQLPPALNTKVTNIHKDHPDCSKRDKSFTSEWVT